MTKNYIINKLLELKPTLKKEGFKIVGIFGSYAREDYTSKSDIDILYTLTDPHQFIKLNGGFGAFTKIREMKEFLAKEFGKNVDFVEKSSLSRTGKKYILEDLVSVA
ncbi:MAG: nucleotidyltransferase domain-containing protein [Sulfurovum sp.]|nr:nucleotidyltransferase domain-containing protein [Sulfurovum sp.]